MDYSTVWGITIGILTALCTVLIGWQIFVLVDTKGLRKDFNDLNKKIETNARFSRMETYFLIGQSCYLNLNPVSAVPFLLMALSEYGTGIENPDAKEVYDASIDFLKLCLPSLKKMDESFYNLKAMHYDSSAIESFRKSIALTADRELIEWSWGFVAGKK